MERKIGEVFTCNGNLYQVVKGFSCNGCAFIKNGNCYLDDKLLGPCAYIERTDKTSVIFKLINNMEIKNNQLIIDIPEGMEIDLENSDLSKGIIKLKHKNLTYEDILQAYTIEYGSLVVSSRNIDKLLAVSKLMDIAKYYNKGWKPDFDNDGESKYYIGYSKRSNKYVINLSVLCTYTFIYFKNKEDARTVINNPNFRDILDVVYKN